MRSLTHLATIRGANDPVKTIRLSIHFASVKDSGCRCLAYQLALDRLVPHKQRQLWNAGISLQLRGCLRERQRSLSLPCSSERL